MGSHQHTYQKYKNAISIKNVLFLGKKLKNHVVLMANSTWSGAETIIFSFKLLPNNKLLNY